jgi:hypothetical protein
MSGDLLVQFLEKQQELAALKERRALVRANGLASYQPHWKQRLFHEAGRFKRRYVRTGNRFGKSLMGAAEDCSWARGERAFFEKSNPARYDGIPRRSTKGVIIVADWGKAHEIFTNEADGQAQGKLFKLLPRGSYSVRREHGNITEVFVESIHGGTSSITLDTIKSFKANKLGAESGDYDWIHVDEPCPEEMFKAYSRGLVDRGGSFWFTCTPLMEMWMNDLFQPDGNVRTELQEAFINRQDINGVIVESWMITGSMHDNPNLSSQSKAEFIASLSQSEIETRIHGKPKGSVGLIYSEFDPSDILAGGHVWRTALPQGWKNQFTPPENWTRRAAVDTHPSANHAVLSVATSPEGFSIFFNEIWDHPYMKVLALQVLAQHGGRLPHRTLLELAAYNDSPYEGALTLADELIQGGLTNVEPATKDLSYGILAVQQALSKRKVVNFADGPRELPILSFMPHLFRTIWEFGRYVFNPETGKPVDKDDHMMENLYRLVITDLSYVAPVSFARRDQPLIPSMKAAALPKTDLRLVPGAVGRPRADRAKRYPAAPGHRAALHSNEQELPVSWQPIA